MHIRSVATLLACQALLSAAVFAAPGGSNVDEVKAELLKLQSLKDQNLITDAEFQSMRKEVLTKFGQSRSNAAVFSCSYDASQLHLDLAAASEFSQSAAAHHVVREILDAAGVAPSFIVRPHDVPNAAAAISGAERYILYNPAWLEDLKSASRTNWSVYSVMAHEIAHHLNGHTLRPGGSRPDFELEADEYSGFILSRLGADLAQAQVALKKFANDTATATHPAKQDRLDAARRGWNRAHEQPNSAARRPAEEDAEPPGEALGTPVPRAQPRSQPQTPMFGNRCCINQEPACVMMDGAHPIGSVCWCMSFLTLQTAFGETCQ